ncbi:hypothetical protein [Rhodanobacter ginsengiterrae]|uniref:hypothetical protein n=1 Tax=Rhodanobacter ginsengiterrae TaxID=2008451 RepID=UPI003CFA9E9B
MLPCTLHNVRIVAGGYVDGIVAHARQQGPFCARTDVGGTWVQINDAQHRWGGVSRVAGDPRSFGTVYLGTNSGRGIIYGTSTH